MGPVPFLFAKQTHLNFIKYLCRRHGGGREIIMKILIVGSRGIKDFDLEGCVPPRAELIISGGANGVDTLAEKYADKHKLSKLILRPQYDKYGRAAPLKRNEIMVDIADEVLVIWDGVSRGTRYTAEYAKKMGKSVSIIEIK